MNKQRFFEVTITDKWIETMLDYQHGENHAQVAAALPIKNKRVMNERYNQIERTGKYYRITEMQKGGKSFIFEATE